MDTEVRELVESVHSSELMVSVADCGCRDAGGGVDSGRRGRVQDGA